MSVDRLGHNWTKHELYLEGKWLAKKDLDEGQFSDVTRRLADDAKNMTPEDFQIVMRAAQQHDKKGVGADLVISNSGQGTTLGVKMRDATGEFTGTPGQCMYKEVALLDNCERPSPSPHYTHRETYRPERPYQDQVRQYEQYQTQTSIRDYANQDRVRYRPERHYYNEVSNYERYAQPTTYSDVRYQPRYQQYVDYPQYPSSYGYRQRPYYDPAYGDPGYSYPQYGYRQRPYYDPTYGDTGYGYPRYPQYPQYPQYGYPQYPQYGYGNPRYGGYGYGGLNVGNIISNVVASGINHLIWGGHRHHYGGGGWNRYPYSGYSGYGYSGGYPSYGYQGYQGWGY